MLANVRQREREVKGHNVGTRERYRSRSGITRERVGLQLVPSLRDSIAVSMLSRHCRAGLSHAAASRLERDRFCFSLLSEVFTRPSDAHGHDDVAVFVVVAFGGAELAGGLGVF